MSAPAQRDFRLGEVAPSFYGRADLSLYGSGLRTLRNAYVKRMGGIESRPGTIYKGTTKDGGAVVLVEAVFDDAENYVLEFGDQYVRFWLDGALVEVSGVAAWVTATAYVAGDVRENGGTNYICLEAHTSGTFATDLAAGKWYALVGDILEVPTDYAAADLEALQFAVQYRVVTIAHPSYPPAVLTRLGATSWTWVAIDFAEDAGQVQNFAVSGATGSTWGYAIAAIYPASDPRGPVGPATDFIFTNTISLPYLAPYGLARALDPRTLTWDAVDGVTSFYLYLRYGTSGTIYAITVTGTSYVDDGGDFVSATVASSYIPFTGVDDPPFAAAGAYPAVVAAYQQRLLFAAASDTPDVAVASRSASPYTFFTSDPIVDADTLSWRQVGKRLNRIRFFEEAARKLWQFSSVGEAEIQGDVDGILRPGEVNPRLVSQNGISPLVPPLVAGDAILYVQARGNQVQDIWPDGSGSEISRTAWHLLDGKEVVSWCFQRVPDRVVWAVLNDGTMVSLTYNREDQILGWARHDTDGAFERVVCVPEGDEDAVYAVVQRFLDAFEESTVASASWVDADTNGSGTVAVLASVGNGSGDEVARTTDGGATWTYFSITGADALNVWRDIRWCDSISRWVAVSGNINQPSAPAINLATSVTLSSWDSDSINDQNEWHTIVDVPGDGVYAFGDSGECAYTDDGVTWSTFAVSGASVIDRASQYALPSTDIRFIGVDVDTALVYSDDYGETWTAFTGYGADTPWGIAKLPWADRLIASVGNGSWYSDDDGVTWTAGGATGQPITWFTFDESNQRAYGGGLGQTTVVYSDDDGLTWSSISVGTGTQRGVYDATNERFLVTAPSGIQLYPSQARYMERLAVRSLTAEGYVAAFSDSAIQATASGTTVSGLGHLEGKAVSVLCTNRTGGGGYDIVASPYNSEYATLTVFGGSITIPSAYSGLQFIVGLPYVSDIQTLDIETVNGTRKDAGINITKIGLWLEETLGLSARADEPDSDTSLDGFQSLPVVDEDGNATTDPVTGYREVSIDGVWTRGGRIFLRNVDPTPVTIHSISPQGHFGKS